MAVSSLSGSTTASLVAALSGASQASSASGSASATSAALARPSARLQQETDSARVKLSAFGQVQSAAAQVQSSSRALQNSARITNADEAKKVAEQFVSAFNTERAALQGATQSASRGQAAGALAGDGRAQVAATQLQQLTGANASSLQAAGINVQQDGSLAVDAKAIQTAFQQNPQAAVQALGNVGRAAETMAVRQLGATGAVGSAVLSLGNRVQNLEERQSDMQTRAAQAQQAIDSASRRYGFGVSGTNAYTGIFGL